MCGWKDTRHQAAQTELSISIRTRDQATQTEVSGEIHQQHVHIPEVELDAGLKEFLDNLGTPRNDVESIHGPGLEKQNPSAGE
jgi:hypothetical protein